ncbi:helix-turn-helix domain-containing protein [Actinobacillus pleuropneumoniae]|uniref:Helix-turn-helix transcriptional regulator n=1 Tax=Actinobacillus pleuropneumoniae TaxID=715 RepID=A0A9Q4H5L8_ACTPL|nr:helix-turn-helix transcriptional regulator [Actinobacillus pleuropneumoniae]MCL7721465.1 helix-turn-helix domain-containing protein [Actinobacillus pleuropneumoniae]MCL7728528.1 helix-turn-helix domain-containing protein [Actinobacillus pleuropneumoniae]MCL7729473.1 helix-turn-helix domain-containing protein [Actinobacillus pleuropneumoniae]MCY6367878.1 helix-turn-helix transcriptional regulator [Actinobacillus pleuropneumoniae]MCY6384747.1 helix-turn-helix transcriptional regulator [Actino
MCISERLRQVCEAKNWKIKDFAEQTGIAYRTLQGYVGGEREPNAEGMTAIAKAGVNLNWLVSGEGEMFHDISNCELSEKEIELIQHYRKMSNDIQKVFDVSFEQLSKSKSEL